MSTQAAGVDGIARNGRDWARFAADRLIAKLRKRIVALERQVQRQSVQEQLVVLPAQVDRTADSFDERVVAVKQSMAIHQSDCLELGFSVHRAADAAMLVGGASLQPKLRAHRLASTAKHEGMHSTVPLQLLRPRRGGRRSWPPIPARSLLVASFAESVPVASALDPNAVPFVPCVPWTRIGAVDIDLGSLVFKLDDRSIGTHVPGGDAELPGVEAKFVDGEGSPPGKGVEAVIESIETVGNALSALFAESCGLKDGLQSRVDGCALAERCDIFAGSNTSSIDVIAVAKRWRRFWTSAEVQSGVRDGDVVGPRSGGADAVAQVREGGGLGPRSGGADEAAHVHEGGVGPRSGGADVVAHVVAHVSEVAEVRDAGDGVHQVDHLSVAGDGGADEAAQVREGVGPLPGGADEVAQARVGVGPLSGGADAVGHVNQHRCLESDSFKTRTARDQDNAILVSCSTGSVPRENRYHDEIVSTSELNTATGDLSDTLGSGEGDGDGGTRKTARRSRRGGRKHKR